MAAGTPVVATNVHAIRELVEHGTDGYLVNYGDAVSLANAIVSLLGDAHKRALFTEKGIEKVQRTYRWDSITEAFRKEVYET